MLRTVENEVNTGELLPCLDEDTSEGTEQDLVVGGSEAVEVRALAEVLFFLQSSLNVAQLELNFRVGGIEGSKTAKSVSGGILLALLDQVTRGLDKEAIR